ncbi:vancomycin high temperature exclusion protein [Gillisia sp. Q332]|uniref:SanA/YdcF family protein n=1 Tax=Gillisia xinjiangensis TaxID=3384765 RepID=UPI00391AD331
MKSLKKILIFVPALLLLGLGLIWGLHKYIENYTKTLIYDQMEMIPDSSTIIVLGASVFSDGKLSPILKDRIDAGFELFQKNKAKQFLLSGDHKTDDYNEVDAMSNYLIEKGIPKDKIILDHAGYDTYDSMYRSKAVFNISDAIVVTQEFHLPRTLFVAKNLDLNYIGYIAKNRVYKPSHQLLIREKLANLKAVWEIIIDRGPTTLENPYND